MLMVVLLLLSPSLSFRRIVVDLLCLSQSLSQCTSSPTRGQATHQFLFLSSVVSYSAEILTTSVPGFGRGGASGFAGGGAPGLARELFEGGVGMLMIAVVTSPLLLQFRLPDSSDIRLRLERLVLSGCCSPHWMCKALSSCRLCVCECVFVALRGGMFFLVLREQQVPVMPSSLERDGLCDGKFCSAVCRYPCSYSRSSTNS